MERQPTDSLVSRRPRTQLVTAAQTHIRANAAAKELFEGVDVSYSVRISVWGCISERLALP